MSKIPNEAPEGRDWAEELRAAREEAWDDGYSAGAHDEAFGGTEPNPYCLEDDD